LCQLVGGGSMTPRTSLADAESRNFGG
jgi:hypothetical protein